MEEDVLVEWESAGAVKLRPPLGPVGGARKPAGPRGGDLGSVARTGERSLGRTGDLSLGRTGERSLGRTGERSLGVDLADSRSRYASWIWGERSRVTGDRGLGSRAVACRR